MLVYKKSIIISFILFVTFLLFSKSINYEFLNWDDDVLVYNNKYVTLLASNYSGIEKSSLTDFFQHDPVTILSHAISIRLFGINPKPFHLINILLHLFNILLVFKIILHFSQNLKISAFTSLFFAIHPFRLESVAWIAERKDVLSAFFLLVGIILYLSYVKSSKYYFLCFCLIAFLLSVLSKFSGIVFPFILFLIDYYKKRSFTKQIIFEKLPFLFFMFFFVLINFFIKNEGYSSQAVLNPFTVVDRFFFANYSFVIYFIKTIIPFDLCAFYQYPVKHGNFLPPEYYFSPLLAVAIIVFLIFIIRKNRSIKNELIFAALFYLINISIVLHFVNIAGRVVVAERYTYIAHIGFFLFFSTLIENSTSFFKFSTKKIKYYFLFLFLALITIISWKRIDIWKNSISFWSDILKSRSYPVAYYSRGLAKAYKADYKGSILDFEQAVLKDSSYAEPYNNMGTSKLNLGLYHEAIKDINKAIQINPQYENSYHNRALAKYYLGDTLGALSDFNKAIIINKNFCEALCFRGKLFIEIKQFENAVNDFDKAVNINPNKSEIYYNRAKAKFSLHRINDAFADFDFAIKLNPENSNLYFKIAQIKINLQDYRGAINYYENAIKYNQGCVDCFYNMGFARLNLKDYQGAIKDFSKAIEINPEFVYAINNRAFCKIILRDFNGALNDLNRALLINPNDIESLYNRGNAYIALQNNKAAFADWNKAASKGHKGAFEKIKLKNQ